MLMVIVIQGVIVNNDTEKKSFFLYSDESKKAFLNIDFTECLVLLNAVNTILSIRIAIY
jgi:hypothetical protein